MINVSAVLNWPVRKRWTAMVRSSSKTDVLDANSGGYVGKEFVNFCAVTNNQVNAAFTKSTQHAPYPKPSQTETAKNKFLSVCLLFLSS